MNVNELNRLNRDPGFESFRMKNYRPLMPALTAGGCGVILLWEIFDHLYHLQHDPNLLILRATTIAFLLMNMMVAYRRPGHTVKGHIIAGFYAGTLFCTLTAVFTGASQSPYWFALFFILIAWFVVMPLGYRSLIIHGTLFLLLFIGGIALGQQNLVAPLQLGRIGFLYAVTLGVGTVSAWMKNSREAELYLMKNELSLSNINLRKFRTVIDQAPGAVFILDKSFTFEYINPCFTTLSGYTADELLHRNIRDTIYKGIDEIPESRREIISSLTSGKSWQGELLTYRKEGTPYWANTIASAFRNEKGEIDGYVVIQQDVTEQKKIFNDLKEHEHLHRTLIEDSLEGVVIVQDYRFFFVNRVFSELTGYTLDELNSINPSEILVPEDRERVLEIHEKRMKGEAGARNYQAGFIRKDGTTFLAEMNSSNVMLRGKNASFITMRDITARMAFEKALRESETKYKTLVENSQDGIIIVRNNLILFANNAYLAMIGHPEEVIYNTPAAHFIHPDDRERALDISRRRMNGEEGTINETFRLLAADGSAITCESYSTVIDYNGAPASFFTLHDISQVIRMQEALVKSETKYRTLIEKAVDGIIITQHGRLKFVNTAFCNLMQYDESDLIERPYLELVSAENHAMMNAYHARRMQGEEFQSIYRSTIIKKDGTPVQVELNARTSYYNDEPAAFIIVRDITDRLQTEEELRQAKTELETLNRNLEIRVKESTLKLTEANTQLIRLQKENLQSQFEVLRQQVNPHFLFNSLNVLTSLIKLEPDLAEKFTEHLSKVYRYVLENKDHDLVSLHTELDFLDAYLFLLNIRFMDKIRVEVNIEEHMKEYHILPLALQLIIENAIKHNTMSKKAPLVIRLFIDEQQNLNIINNLQERESQMISTGVGLKNIAHRYQLLEMPAPEFFKTSDSFVARIPLKYSEHA